MTASKQLERGQIRLVTGDLTAQDVECIVFYATDDLKLGSGFGGAIAVRGGPTIQQECDELAPIELGQAVITKAGELKSKYIIHANGPKFQEENLENKLKTTIENTLRVAKENQVKQIAFPPMGTGFYGVPLDVSARISIDVVKNHLAGETSIEDVVFYLLDTREFRPFEAQLQKLT